MPARTGGRHSSPPGQEQWPYRAAAPNETIEKERRHLAPRMLPKGAKVQPVKEAATRFLSHKRIAVTGVSRKPASHGGNIVYQRLRDRGYEVFAINPNADEVEGDRCYHDLKSIPGGVDAVVIATSPDLAQATIEECASEGVKNVWMHRAFGKGSVSETAAEWGRQHGLTVIEGGCPLMFEPCSDKGHKVMKFVFTMTGKVPKSVRPPETRVPH
jgi:predicted CoA-binding protein